MKDRDFKTILQHATRKEQLLKYLKIQLDLTRFENNFVELSK